MSWSAWEACMFNGSDVALVVSDDCQIMKAVNRIRFHYDIYHRFSVNFRPEVRVDIRQEILTP